MSRADHRRAVQLVRLRDHGLQAAMRALGDAAALLAEAEARVAQALAARDRAVAAHAASRAALVETPEDAPAGLARIALAADAELAAGTAADEAEQARRVAEDAVIAARARVLRARARHEAMSERAHTLKRGIVRIDDDHAATEVEEGAAAMRSAA